MTKLEQYGQRIFSHAGDNEHLRLPAIADALDINTFGLIDALQPQSDWRCLELGAGAGTVARWMSARCPNGSVIATELKPTHRLLADAAASKVKVLEHDLTVDDFPEGSFDLVHARWLFCHLRQRDLNLTRVSRWLAPGGWLLIEDAAIFPVDSSPSPTFRKMTMAMNSLVESRIGTDLDWARRFPEPLRALGLGSIGVAGFLPVVGGNHPLTAFWRHSLEQLAPDLQASGVVSADEVRATLNLLDDPAFVDFGMASIAAWGQLALSR
jgi:SAM-dependent methyltransferase